ncbi:hypothetical protein A2368_03320 [Candidatus Collierbacteria bacterium RIFOXYB1_FULL_49_13]|uniref:Uncharacterized protein n=1 Tax=Candidatus Collierbacteria bacterium RIFOXYB1_FULL_49_13 TaxID=1817728 RepID=A0A1F5FGN7_9BACT|nr:MAG: hypothetical protein A2368_03320 [Candidatus Collierbacteria bacterium RIFOXYB1_FULL_49_13]
MDDLLEQLITILKKQRPSMFNFHTKWIVEGIRYELSDGRVGTTVVFVDSLDGEFGGREWNELYTFFFGQSVDDAWRKLDQFIDHEK